MPPSYEIGCFRYSAKLYPKLLGDLKANWEDTQLVVNMCRQLAHSQGYKTFALGNGAKCYAAPNKEVKLKKNVSKNCPEGLGKRKVVFAYTFGE